MSPLVLLGLLTFFFVIALSFALWSALTLGDAARRRHDAQQRSAKKPAAAKRSGTARQPTPFEVNQPRPNPALRVNKPQPAEPQPVPTRPATTLQAQAEPKPTPDKEAERVAKVVVTPRKANDDAFERFLESEKRRG